MKTGNGSIKKRIPVGKRSPYFCVWLQEMAEQGLILKSVGFFNCEFEKSEPEKRRYRILDKSYFSMSEEEKGIYEDAGWKYVPNEETGVTVFVSDDEDAPELFSDKESYRKYRRNKRVGSITLILMWIYWIARSIWAGYDLVKSGNYSVSGGRLHSFNGESLSVLVLMGLITVVFTGICAYHIFNEILTIRRNAENDLPQYDIPYNDKGYLWEKKASRLYDFAVIVMAAGLAFLLISISVNDGNPAYGADALNYSGEHPVMLREIDPDEWADARPMIENLNSGEYANDYFISYMAGRDTGACFSRGWSESLDVEKNTVDDDHETEELSITSLHHYYSAYYISRSEVIAEEYLGEEAAYYLYDKVDKDSWSKALEEVRTECDGADYVGYFTTEYAGSECQHLLIRKGKVIEIVEYQGPVNLRNKITMFIDEIND